MTKRDYIRVAAILKEHHASAAIADAFADLFAQDNSLFDREKFYAAAGWREKA